MSDISATTLNNFDMYHASEDLQQQTTLDGTDIDARVPEILKGMDIYNEDGSKPSLDGNDTAGETSDLLLGLWADFMNTDVGQGVDDQNRMVEFRNWLQSEHGLTLEEAEIVMASLAGLMTEESDSAEGGDETFVDRLNAERDAIESLDSMDDADEGVVGADGSISYTGGTPGELTPFWEADKELLIEQGILNEDGTVANYYETQAYKDSEDYDPNFDTQTDADGNGVPDGIDGNIAFLESIGAIYDSEGNATVPPEYAAPNGV